MSPKSWPRLNPSLPPCALASPPRDLQAQEDKDEADQDERDGNQVKIQVSLSLWEGSKCWVTLTDLYKRPRGCGWGALGPGWRGRGWEGFCYLTVGWTWVQPPPQASDFNLLESPFSYPQNGHNNSHFTDVLRGSNALLGDVPSTQCRAWQAGALEMLWSGNERAQDTVGTLQPGSGWPH